MGKSDKPGPSVAAPAGDDFMSRLIEAELAKQGPPCPSCAVPMGKGAVLCTRCGFSTESGKAVRTRVERAPREKGGGGSASRAALDRLTSGPMGYVLALVGGAIGALLGAVAYVVVAERFEAEHQWVALATGVLAGLGTLAVVRDDANIVTGLMAAVLAVGGVVGGRMVAYDRVVGAAVDQVMTEVVVTDEQATAVVARRAARDLAASGKNYAWPEGVDPQRAMAREDFAAPVWEEAERRVASMPGEERAQARAQAESELAALKRELRDHAVESVYNESFSEETQVRSGRFGRRTTTMSFGAMFAGWLLMAGVAAFGIGSQFSLSKD